MPNKGARSRVASVADRLVTLLTSRATPSERPVSDRRWPFVVALGVFVVTTVVAWTQLPSTRSDVRWGLLAALVVVGTPLNLLSTGYEFAVMGRLLGIRVGARAGARIAVLSTAANLLPLPGSVVVRAVSLRERGASFGRIGLAVATMGVGFLTTTGLACGGVLLAAGRPGLGAVLVAGGVVGVALTWLLCRRLGRGVGALADVLASELVLILVVGARLWIVLPGLGYDASVREAAALAAASVAATATGIFPAGLGIREVFSGIAAALVDLEVSVGVLAGAVDRIALGVGLLPVVVWVLWARRGGRSVGADVAQ